MKRWLPLILLPGFLCSTAVFAKEVKIGMQNIPKARIGTLEFDTPPISTVKAAATLCLSDSSQVTKIDLFMPDPSMNHGSAPPHYKKIALPKDKKEVAPDFGCYKLSQMELFMPGLWQVRVFFKDGTKGVFDVTLKD